MQRVDLKYGKGTISVSLPDKAKLDIITPRKVLATKEPIAIVQDAIRLPLDGTYLPPFNLIKSIAIAINDKTRPVPHQYLLPPLLNFLHNSGIHSNQITFIIATGTHKPMTANEFPLILSADIYTKYKIISHDCDGSDLVDIGTTSYGTKIFLNKVFHEADLKIVVGNIEPHHFMGFSGGNKTAAIGLTGRSTINHNHSFLTQEYARTGEYDRNPCRLDVEEIGIKIGTHAALNAILSTDKRIIRCLFGHPKQVMELGIPYSREICQVEVAHEYPIVIASAGGYPKDINLYQAQKAITNAVSVTENNGWVFLFAECIEGIGSELLMDFIKDVHNPDEALQKFLATEFRIGPHKAFQLASQAKRVNIGLISTLDKETCSQVFCTPCTTETVFDVMMKSNLNNKFAIMPEAVTTIPYLKPAVSI